MRDLDVACLPEGDDGDRGDLVAGDRGGLVDQNLGCSFGSWRWIILFSGWFSFALFSATLYTSGKFISGKNCCQICFIAGLFFVIYLQEFGEARSTTAWVSI